MSATDQRFICNGSATDWRLTIIDGLQVGFAPVDRRKSQWKAVLIAEQLSVNKSLISPCSVANSRCKVDDWSMTGRLFVIA